MLNRLSSLPRRGEGKECYIKLQYYPSLLLIYAGGICALAKNNYLNLKAILLDSKYTDPYSKEKNPIISQIYPDSVFSFKYVQNAKGRTATASYYLMEILYEYLNDYIPDKYDFEEVFALFEYILALTYMDLKEYSGSLTNNLVYLCKENNNIKSTLDKFVEQILEQDSEAEILKAGFFKNSIERFKKIVENYKY